MKYQLIVIKIIFIFFILSTQIFNAQKFLEKTDRFTGEKTVYVETKIFADGTPMQKDKADGVIYILENQKFFKRVINCYINIKWFGAVGNGDKNDLGTDDTQAIEIALKTLQKIYKSYDLSGGNLLGGFTLFFPNGKYLINKTLILPSGIIIKGESSSATVIHARQPKFIFTNIGGFYANGVDQIMNENIVIKDITLTQGGIEFQGAISSRIENVRILNLFGKGTDTGISIKLSVDLKIKDVKIFNSTGYGVLFQESIGGKVSTTTTFDSIWIAHCKTGMLIDGSIGSLGNTTTRIYNSIFEYNQIGIQIKGNVTSLALRDLHFEQNSTDAIDLQGNINVTMENLWGDDKGDIKISGIVNNKKINKVYLRNVNIPYKINSADKAILIEN